MARPDLAIELPDAPFLELSGTSHIVDAAMESPQEASLADDVYFPSAATSSGLVDSVRHGRNLSIISIPVSISEGINVSTVQLDSDGPTRIFTAADLPPSPRCPSGRRPSMIEPEPPIGNDAAPFATADMFPQYTLANPPSARASDAKPQHIRGKSSLQEPDMAALLARLEVENTALARDPKSGMAAIGAHTGPHSAFEYNIGGTICSSLATLVIPEDALGTSLAEFWTLVKDDYRKALASMPTMTPLMIHKGVPDSLRAVVWVGITGASDPALQLEFESLTNRLEHERPQNESVIDKDLARCFPQHDKFKEVDGPGQRTLGQVLKAYSLYDPEIAYCQGMAFVVGALLLNMPAKDAFCVFVKLMEEHNLRTMYTHNLGGLHSRTYQLKQLLGSISPDLLAHLSALGVELAYLSQWFMTIFATTCPFDILFRIYDIIFAEGADETIMRVALALIVTNEQSIMAMTELEEVLTLLLGRSLWDPYVQEPDFLIDEVARLCNVVTKAELAKLHGDFLTQSSEGGTVRSLGFTSGLAGLRFLDGWLPSNRPGGSSSISINTDISGHRSRRSVSKQSIATIDSPVRAGTDSLLSSAGTSSTFPTDLESLAEHDTRSIWKINVPAPVKKVGYSHNEQVEALLLALTEVQREAARTAASLREERVKKESMTEMVHRLKDLVTQKELAMSGIGRSQRKQTMPSCSGVVDQAQIILHELNRKSAAITSAAVDLSVGEAGPRDMATADIKDSLSRLCALLETDVITSESAQSLPLRVRKVSAQPCAPAALETSDAAPTTSMRLSDIVPESDITTPSTCMNGHLHSPSYFPEAVLFENSQAHDFSIFPGHVHKRASSLAATNASMDFGTIPTEDAILMELVNAKTLAATAIQERDEMKVELDKARKVSELQRVDTSQMAARVSELERLLIVEREAHTAELAKTLAAAHRRSQGYGGESRHVSRQLSIVPPVSELHTERSNSLWPSEASESRSGSVVGDGPQSAGIVPTASWWWSRNKQRSVSTGNAGPI